MRASDDTYSYEMNDRTKLKQIVVFLEGLSELSPLLFRLNPLYFRDTEYRSVGNDVCSTFWALKFFSLGDDDQKESKSLQMWAWLNKTSANN